MANIAALQISTDTKKYINEVFESLMIPWAMFPESDVDNVRAFLAQHYDKYCLGVYDTAVSLNRKWLRQNAAKIIFRRCYVTSCARKSPAVKCDKFVGQKTRRALLGSSGQTAALRTMCGALAFLLSAKARWED